MEKRTLNSGRQEQMKWVSACNMEISAKSTPHFYLFLDLILYNNNSYDKYDA